MMMVMVKVIVIICYNGDDGDGDSDNDDEEDVVDDQIMATIWWKFLLAILVKLDTPWSGNCIVASFICTSAAVFAHECFEDVGFFEMSILGVAVAPRLFPVRKHA